MARKALWALDGDEPEAAAYPAMAFALASDVAQRTASASLHVHGGYGFMEEYDVQLYFRRAKATRLLAGDPRDGLLGGRRPLLRAGRLTPARRPSVDRARTHRP